MKNKTHDIPTWLYMLLLGALNLTLICLLIYLALKFLHY